MATQAQASSDVELVDLSDVNQLKTFVRFSQVSNMDDGVRIDYELSPKWPSAEFYAPEGQTWDLSAKEAVLVTLTNVGGSTERFFIHLGNPGPDRSKVKTIGSGRTDIAPNETKTIRVPISSDGGFDPSMVEFVRIFTGMHKTPVAVKLSGVKAVGTGSHQAAISSASPTPAPTATNHTPGANSVLPDAAGNLLDLSDVNQLVTDLRFTSVSNSPDGPILDFDLSPKWPSVEFFAGPKKTWDLSSYQFVDAEITNLGSSQERIFIYLANPYQNHNNKTTCGSGRVDIAPGETKTIRLDLSQGNAGFNPADVDAFRIFTGKHKTPVKLKLSSLKAVK
ncbi:MAG: hypothetical protein ACQKBV_00760 [Puniceicoccales bacterium]